MLSRKALALWTCCSAAIALSACEPKRVVTNLAPPAERIDCTFAGAEARPEIPPEHTIDWSRVTTVPQAKAETDAYVRSVRTREGIIAGYIVELEGRLFACSSDDQWLRDWYAATE